MTKAIVESAIDLGVHRFLAGTPNVPGIYAARAGVRAV